MRKSFTGAYSFPLPENRPLKASLLLKPLCVNGFGFMAQDNRLKAMQLPHSVAPAKAGVHFQ